MKKKKIILLLIIISLIALAVSLIVILPVCIRMDDSVDLGSGYRYNQDYPQSIYFTYETKELKKMTRMIIQPVVLKFRFNNKYIIAKTIDFHNNDTIYWIVYKKKQKTECYLDSIEFYRILNERNINIELYNKRRTD